MCCCCCDNTEEKNYKKKRNHRVWNRQIARFSKFCSKMRNLLLNLNYRSFSIAVCFSHYVWSDTKIIGEIAKTKSSWNFLLHCLKIHNFNFIFSAFSECHPTGWSICWVCWTTYSKNDTNLRKPIPAAERLMRQVIYQFLYLTYFEWERKAKQSFKSFFKITCHLQKQRVREKIWAKNLVTYDNSHTWSEQ